MIFIIVVIKYYKCIFEILFFLIVVLFLWIIKLLEIRIIVLIVGNNNFIFVFLGG